MRAVCSSRRLAVLLLLLLATTATRVHAQRGSGEPPTPPRKSGEGEGPYKRLIIRGATMIDGAGAPPQGPVDIVIEGDRIAEIRSVGAPKTAINPARRPAAGDREIDAHGMYVMPGFIDLHVHAGGGSKNPPEYAYKLWLAHGVTTVRGVNLGGFDWALNEQARSARNEIAAPRIVNYQRPGSGWDKGPIRTPEDARAWVRWAAQKGVDGMKLVAYDPPIMEALLDEARKHGLGSTAHLAQNGVARMNALDAARLGLGAMTHFYGLFEAMYEANDIQPWPVDMNYSDEYHRFSQVARQWSLVKPRGEKWNALLKEFLDLNFVIDPTMTIYDAGRDVMRARNADWHEKYTLPSLWDFFQPSRTNHGAYWFDWTLEDEVAYKNFYRVWMQFLNDYKNMGGRVTTGSDAGFIYSTYGFGYIRELELLQEAGFHPLEVIRAATLHGAEAIFEPKGKPIEYGILRPGLKADLVLVGENPLQNLKVLYGTGAVRLNDETGQVERVGGVRYTIKDGIVYDAKALLADVAEMVEAAKRARPVAAAEASN